MDGHGAARNHLSGDGLSRVLIASHPEHPTERWSSVQTQQLLRERPHWRLELQLSLSWLYAGGAESRWFSNPDNSAVGEPR